MNIKVEYEDLSVDAGNLSIIDSSKITNPQKFDDPVTRELELDPGRYRVKYSFRGWDGPSFGEEQMNIPSGKVIIGDACYSFDTGWHEYLAETEYLLRTNDGSALFFDTGGDGSFDLGLEFTKVGDIE